MNKNFTIFYKRWVIANGVAESVGLSGTFLLGFIIMPLIESESVASIISIALSAVVIGVLLEGVIVGIAQSIPLRLIAPEIRAKSRGIATAIGVRFAWLTGMIPSTLIALFTHSLPESAPTEPPANGLAQMLWPGQLACQLFSLGWSMCPGTAIGR